MQGRNYVPGVFYQRTNPLQHFRMENGGIALARNSLESDHAQILPQHPFPRSFDIKNLSSRQQLLFSSKHGMSRASPLISNDITQANNLINKTMFQTQDKSSTLNRIDVMDVRTRNGSLRGSQFLEDKKWPPRESIGNQWKAKRIVTDNIQASTISQPPMHQNGTTLIKTDFETPFRFELNQKRKLKHKEWLPDLQLGLSQSLGKHDEKTPEINTMLSLSLSPSSSKHTSTMQPTKATLSEYR
ncbi:unnamed protein product [Ilex paraguariensis]|uniref:Uncharacterized protein n=1 Tax=Ilex paraguariensis TaxID=185542 RepID=A0ABC8S637_9AQUA